MNFYTLSVPRLRGADRQPYGESNSMRARPSPLSSLIVLAGLGAPARALFTSALRVTAYCDVRALPDAARELHQRLLG